MAVAVTVTKPDRSADVWRVRVVDGVVLAEVSAARRYEPIIEMALTSEAAKELRAALRKVR